MEDYAGNYFVNYFDYRKPFENIAGTYNVEDGKKNIETKYTGYFPGMDIDHSD